MAAIWLCPMATTAQKKVISQAQTYIKSGKELDKAERLMSTLLADSAHHGNIKIRLLLYEAVQKQYEQGNEKLFLQQQYDTAQIFIATYKMFRIATDIDSLDAIPDKKGRVKFKYRQRNAYYLNIIRSNLFNGGMFFSGKSDYARAYDFYKAYIDCTTNPLFGSYEYGKHDRLLPRAASKAMYCGYKMKRPEYTLRYMDLALQDYEKLPFVYQYLADTYLLGQDSVRYVTALKKGFALSPDFPYFLPRLIDYYEKEGKSDSVIVVIDQALAIDSTNQVYRLAKSTALLNAGEYEKTIGICESLLAENDSLPDAHLNLGLAYFNQAVELDKQSKKTKATQRKIRDLYEKSRPWMEAYRTFMPDKQQLWLPILYTVYLNLNMGKEFDEMESLRNKTR